MLVTIRQRLKMQRRVKKMSNYIAFEPINKYTAGRDILVWNETDNEKLNELIKEMSADYRGKFISSDIQETGWTVEFDKDYFKIAIGVSPRYIEEKLDIIIIEKDISKSKYVTGFSRGYYGSTILSKEKSYNSMVRGKAKEFIDKWHNQLLCFKPKEESK